MKPIRPARRRWRSQHPITRSLLLSTLVVLALGLFAVVSATLTAPDTSVPLAVNALPTLAPAFALVFGVTPLAAWWTSRQLGGWDQYDLFGQALRTGDVPRGAAADEWRPAVARAIRSQRSARGLGWLAVLWIVWQLIVLARSLQDDPSIWPIAVVVLIAFTGVILIVHGWFRRQAHRMRRLAEALDR